MQNEQRDGNEKLKMQNKLARNSAPQTPFALARAARRRNFAWVRFAF